MQLHGLAPVSFMEMYTSFIVIVRWMPQISLTMPEVLKSLLLNVISLVEPSGGQFEKVKCSFSLTTRVFGNLWALRPAIGCSHKTLVMEVCTIRMERQLL